MLRGVGRGWAELRAAEVEPRLKKESPKLSHNKVSMGTLKVYLVPIVWHTAPPKFRKFRFLAA